MNMKPLRPTSTTGLKRLAHGLKKHRDLTQSEAMEHAAVLAGYRNLREAQLAFGETPAPSVLNTAHFCDEVRRKTVETRIQLSRLLGSFLHRNDLRICDRFAKFALVGQDHIVAEFGQVEDSYVRRCIAQVARTTQFMDATGLKPNTDEIYGFPTFSKIGELSQPSLECAPAYNFCCNQVERSPGMQSRNVTKSSGGCKA